jgi:hypothetical protein
MQLRGHELTYPHLLFAIVILITVGVCIAALGTSTATFGAYNHDWDGASDLRSLAANSGSEVQVLRSSAGYHEVEAEQATAFVLSPTASYTGSEAQAISTFLERGGTVVVAADSGSQTNQLLAALDVDSRFDGQQLRDEQRYYRSPALPVASPAHESPVTRNISQITLNHGTAVAPSENADALVNSSSFSYLDSNSNAELDSSEPIHQYPVVVREDVANGSVILVSDASVFINEMLERPDNQQLARNLLTTSETVLLDYQHRDGIPTAVALVHTAADAPILQWMIVAVLTVGVGIAWSKTPIHSDRSNFESPADETHSDRNHDDVVAKISERHPEWNAERVERVARSITRNGSK